MTIVRRIRLISFLVIFLSGVFLYGICLKGVITDKSNGKTIPYAQIRDIKSGKISTSDSVGRFELCDEHLHTIEIRHTSYKNKTLLVSLLQNEDPLGIIPIQLDEKVQTIKEVTVLAKKNDLFNSTFAGNQSIQQKEILNLPTFLGEADVIKSVQLLSGVQSVSEGNGGVFVRGGSSGQNLFILDDMELLNPTHLMGIYSVFNPLTTANVELFRGNSPVQWQDHLSSAIIVQSKTPRKNDSGTMLSLGNISSTLALSHISKDEKLSYIFGLRESYLNVIGWLASPFMADKDNYFKTNRYRFYDINGSVKWRITNKSILSMSGYTGTDNFKTDMKKDNYTATTDWGNNCLALVFQHTPSNQSLFKHTLSYSTVFSEFKGSLIDYSIYLGNSFTQIQQKNQWFFESEKHSIITGLEFFYHHSIPQNISTNFIGSSVSRKEQFKNAGMTVYVGDNIRIKPNATLYLGMRGVVNNALSPYSYSDKLWSNTNEVVKTHYSWSPSISLSVIANENRSFKFSYSRNNQQVHLSSISSIPLPYDVRMSSTPMLKPETSHQLSFGVYQKSNKFDYSIEFYGKIMQNQLVYNMNIDNSTAKNFEDNFYSGKGLVYGMDLSISKKLGDVTGELNYSLSHSQRSFPQIMNGEWFNDKYDRTHDLKLHLSSQINKKWSWSMIWVFASGNMMTLAPGRLWMMGNIVNDYNGFNNYRLPDYHRLDVSANYKVSVQKWKELLLSFSIINVYNRSNPYFVFYQIIMDKNRYNINIKTSQVSLFPIMPSISWRVKF